MIVINGRFLTDRPSGVHRFAIEMIRQLGELRTNLVIAAPRTAVNPDIPGVEFLRVGRLRSALWEQLELPLWLATKKTPLLINLANRAPVAYKRQVSTVHDLMPILFKEDYSRRFALQYRLIVKYGVIRHSLATCTVSDTARRELVDYFNVAAGRVEVTHNGADRYWTRSSPDSAADTLAIDGLSANKYFLAFGRYGHHKNVRVLLAAVKEVARCQDVTLVLVGDYDESLRSAMVGLDQQVRVLGRITDQKLGILYSNARAFVAPSLHEGFDIPALEAQVHGALVLASDIPVHREVLGDGALYFAPSDVSQLVKLLVTVLAEPELGNARDRAIRENSARFGWAKSARTLNEIVARAERASRK